MSVIRRGNDPARWIDCGPSHGAVEGAGHSGRMARPDSVDPQRMADRRARQAEAQARYMARRREAAP